MSGRCGEYPTYSHGCRCEACRLAARLYRSEQRKRSLAAGTLTHGFSSTYDAGCRCPECTDARSRKHHWESRREVVLPAVPAMN